MADVSADVGGIMSEAEGTAAHSIVLDGATARCACGWSKTYSHPYQAQVLSEAHISISETMQYRPGSAELPRDA